MNISRLLSLLATLLVCGCRAPSPLGYQNDEEQKICEMVLLNHLALRDTNRIAFVAFRKPDGSYIDPSHAAIAKFLEAGISVRRASESTTDEHTVVIDKASGLPGVIYYSGVVRWLSDSKVEAIEGSTCASLGGGFTVFIMKREGGVWIRSKIKRIVTI